MSSDVASGSWSNSDRARVIEDDDGNEIRNPFYNTGLTVRDFEKAYNVHAAFLPFAYQDEDDDDESGFERLEEVTTFLNGRPRSCQSVSKPLLYGSKVLDLETDSKSALLDLDLFCLVSGWWPTSGTKHTGTDYQNPDHYHPSAQDHITDRDARTDLYHRVADLGIHDAVVIAPMIGYREHNDPAGSVQNDYRRSGVSWAELRRVGKVRIARTFKTIREWGVIGSEISAAFGLPKDGANRRIYEYARDFQPPKDPCYAENLYDVRAEVRERVE